MAKRVQYILLGLLGGLAFWGLASAPADWHAARGFVGAAIFAAVFFGAVLAMLGDLGPRRALLSAGALALGVAALGLLKSFGFVDAGQMLGTGHVVVALLTLASLPVPFLIARELGGKGHWVDYQVLFIETWNILVRYAAAWLFVGTVWLVLWLLAMLLRLVGVEALADLLGSAPAIWLVSGAALGLGLSVVTEMPDMVSPYLLLRLFRLLLPLVLAVELVFVAVLPLRGLTHLFGHLSAAGILIATALAAIGLVSVAVDQDDVEAAHDRVLPVAGRGLAMLLPLLAGLAIWALAERVTAHGWTPMRVTAAAGSGVIAGYGVLYAASVLTGRRWMGWIRRANVAMALGMIGLAALWLTPLISPETIATRSQMARFEAGRIAEDQLPLWQFAHDWGKPGAAALADLRARAAAPEGAALAMQLARLDRAVGPWDLEPTVSRDLATRASELRGVVAVLPAGAVAPEALLEEIARLGDESWAPGCAAPTAAGNPGCLIWLGDLAPARPGREALFLRAAGGTAGTLALRESGTLWQIATPVFPDGGAAPAGAALIDALSAGAEPVAADLRALSFGGRQVTILP